MDKQQQQWHDDFQLKLSEYDLKHDEYQLKLKQSNFKNYFWIAIGSSAVTTSILSGLAVAIKFLI